MTNPNEIAYLQIVKQEKYEGQYVLIIDGNLIDSGFNKKDLLKKVRGKYLRKLRFIKKIPEKKLEKLILQ